MAFDFGLKQIGVAIGNCLLATTQPLAILKARDGIPDWQAVGNLLEEWQPDLLLVGNIDHYHLNDLSRKTERYIKRKIRS